MAAEKDGSDGVALGSPGQVEGASDRRQAQRVLTHLEVDCRCEDHFLFAYITDLSTLGIFIRTDTPEGPGTRLNLRFRVPGAAQPLDVEGEVIWVNHRRPGDLTSINPGMGVQFVDLPREHRAQLRRLIKTICILDGEAEEGPDSDRILVDDLQAAGHPSSTPTD